MPSIIQSYIAFKMFIATCVFILSIVESTSTSPVIINKAFIGRAILNLLYAADIIFIKLELSTTRITSALIHMATRNYILLFVFGYMRNKQFSLAISACWFLLDCSHYIYSLIRGKYLRIIRYYVIIILYPICVIFECLSIYNIVNKDNYKALNIFIVFSLILYTYTSIYLFFRVLRQRHWYRLKDSTESYYKNR